MTLRTILTATVLALASPRLVAAAPLTLTPTAELSLFGARDDEPAPDLKAAAPPPAYASKGSNRWYGHGGFAVNIKDSSDVLGLGGVGWEHFFVDGLSINAELNAVGVLQDGTDALGLQFGLFFRWHFYRQETWSIFADAGAGMLGTTNPVPANGTSFNFTPQAGLGFSTDIGDGARLYLGARWLHISNASLSSNNPGRDHVMGFVAVSFPF